MQRITGHFTLIPRDILRSYSKEMAALVISKSHQLHYDVVIASCMGVGEYALGTNIKTRILEEHNFTTAWMEERYRNLHSPLQRIAGWITWRKCQRYERWLYPHFQAVSMVSENDLRAVRRTMPGYEGNLEVIPNGVDLERNRPGMYEPQAERLVFNGSLSYAANREAMRFFCGRVLPLIREERPQARLLITGSTQGADLQGIAGEPGVELSGYLEDVRPAVGSAWLAVAPILSGGGTRLKILEAMALGTPVAATRKGAEGLEVTDGKHILLAEQAPELARACLRLLGEPGLRQRLAENARRLVERQYGWQEIGRKFCRLVERAAEGEQGEAAG